MCKRDKETKRMALIMKWRPYGLCFRNETLVFWTSSCDGFADMSCQQGCQTLDGFLKNPILMFFRCDQLFLWEKSPCFHFREARAHALHNQHRWSNTFDLNSPVRGTWCYFNTVIFLMHKDSGFTGTWPAANMTSSVSSLHNNSDCWDQLQLQPSHPETSKKTSVN